jgi:hypothetical protein
MAALIEIKLGSGDPDCRLWINSLKLLDGTAKNIIKETTDRPGLSRDLARATPISM